MKNKFLKNAAASVFVGVTLLMAMPVMTAHGEILAAEEYNVETVQVHNAAVPLSMGRLKNYECFGTKLKADYGYDFLMVRNADFEKYRPACCEAILEYSRKARSNVVNTLAKYNDIASKLPSSETVPYSVFESIEVRRADARAVSLLGTSSNYTGGVHGMYGVKGTNFNSATGEELKLSGICHDVSRFMDIVDEKIEQQYTRASFFNKADRINELKKNSGADINWVLGYEGITVYFNPYEIACYADGIISVTVPFIGNEDLFDSYYTKAPDVYALTAAHSVDYGFKAGGDFKRLRFFSAVGEYNEKNPLIVIGDNRLKDTSVFGDELSPLFVHLDGVGEDYLYVFIRRAEYYQLNVYRVTGSEPEKVGEITGMRRAIDKLDMEFIELGTKPEAMMLEKITNEIDGLYTRGVYTVGADGMPILLHEME